MSSFWDTVGHTKDVASIVTPLAVVVFGIYLNKTIQTQNRIAERRSAFTKQRADEFYNLAGEVYDTTLGILLLFFQAEHHEHFVIGDKKKFFDDMNSETRRVALRLEEQKLRLEKYVDLAPATGGALNQAFKQLKHMTRRWMDSPHGGDTEHRGDTDVFRKLQASFNQRARDTHREILALDN